MDLLDPGSSAWPRGQLRGLGRGAGVGCPSSRLRLCWSSCLATASGPCSETPRPPCSASLSLSSAPLHPAESQAVPHFESDHPPTTPHEVTPFPGPPPFHWAPRSALGKAKSLQPTLPLRPHPRNTGFGPSACSWGPGSHLRGWHSCDLLGDAHTASHQEWGGVGGGRSEGAARKDPSPHPPTHRKGKLSSQLPKPQTALVSCCGAGWGTLPQTWAPDGGEGAGAQGQVPGPGLPGPRLGSYLVRGLGAPVPRAEQRGPHHGRGLLGSGCRQGRGREQGLGTLPAPAEGRPRGSKL